MAATTDVRAWVWLLAVAGCDGDGGDPELEVDAGATVDAARLDGSSADATPPDAAPPDGALPDVAVPDAQPDGSEPDARGCEPVAETCNGADDDCDGESDEGVVNACGLCGALPPESCNGVDDDCDGSTDEAVRNACGQCGAVPEERCTFEDDDCDGLVDEADGVQAGLRNACDACGPVPAEVCNEQDDDCDGEVDEGLLNACGRCGAPPPEVCNDRDDDCDGLADEGVLNPCGACGPVPDEACNERDDDCDDAVDEFLPQNRCGTGCGPEPAEVCNAFDDDCDGGVDEGLPVNACGVCGVLPEELCDFEDNDCDGQTDEGFVYNACGGCGAPPDEVCEGAADEDCDGRVDEGFDVGLSAEHCLGCDAGCSEFHAVPSCLRGRCIVLRCEDGWTDADVDPANGCEAMVPPGGVVFVDARAAPGGDGSAEAPFVEIAEALAAEVDGARVVEPGDRVLVLPGDYAGFTLETRRVTVSAQARRDARVNGAVRVTGDGARVEGLQLVGASLELACGTGCGAIGNLLADLEGLDHALRVTGGESVEVANNAVVGFLPGNSGRGNPFAAVGIGVFGARSVVVVANEIRRLEQLDRNFGGAPGVGILLDGVDGAEVLGNEVGEVVGSAAVAGVMVLRSVGVVVTENEVADVGGFVSTAGLWIDASRDVRLTGNSVRLVTARRSFQGQPTGAGGLRVADSEDVTASGNEVSDLQAEGPEWGLHGVDLRGALEGIRIGPDNLWDGSPLVAYIGVDGVRIEDLRVGGRGHNTNLGKVVLWEVADVVVRGVEISGVPGGGAGAVAAGLRIHAADGVELEGVRIDDIAATGGLSFPENRSGAGDAFGILMTDVSGARLRDVEVRDVREGEQRIGSVAGRAVGITGSQSSFTVDRGVFSDISGAAVELLGDRSLGRLRNLTVHDVGRGVVVEDGAELLGVFDSVFALLRGPAVEGPEGGASPVGWCAYDRVPEPVFVGAVVDDATIVAAPVRFTDEIFGDLSLAPNSPCVDSGDPDAACADEPRSEDGSCRMDMGHLGGTAAARAR